MKLKWYGFVPGELSLKAYVVYSNSSFEFYIDSHGLFYVADNSKAKPRLCITGTLEDVNKYLESF